MKKLKVFVLGTRGFPNIQGGVEKHCEQLYPRLVKLGCDVTVVARTPYIPKEKRLSEWKGVKFLHLRTPKQKYLETITHTFLGVLLARLSCPDILHIHAVGPALMIPFARVLGLKVVFTNHGPDYRRQKWGAFAKIVLRAGEFSGITSANKVIVISHNIKDTVQKKYGRKSLECIHNGVTLPEIVPAGNTLKKYGLEQGKYVFNACRFVPEKGLHDLIISYCRIENPPFKLVIAGDADHKTGYSEKIKKLAKKSKNVILTGFISGTPLKELYSNAGLFILPSYYEGLPIVLLEAMSYGLPVLVSNIPAHRELNLPQFRFFPAGDVNKLSVKTVELFKRGISEEEREKQRIMIEKNYNWDRIAEQTLQVYKEC